MENITSKQIHGNNSMFSFSDNSHKIIESNVKIEDMQEKYIDKYMIVTNTRVVDTHIHGDVIAILTPAEYNKLKKPENMLPKYSVWVGYDARQERFGIYGDYI